MAQLLLHILVDPDTCIDRPGPDGARAQLAGIVLYPGPPRCEDVRRWKPDIGCLVQDLPCHVLQQSLTFAFITLKIYGLHFLVVFAIRPLRWIPDLPGDEALADGRRRVGVSIVHHVIPAYWSWLSSPRDTRRIP